MSFMKLSNHNKYGYINHYNSASDAKCAPIFGNDSYTKFLLHFNGSSGSTSIIDNSPNSTAFTAYGNASISTAQSTAFDQCLYLDGTGDYVAPSDNSLFTIGTSSFTLDIRAYPLSTSSLRSIVDMRPSDSSTGFVLRINSGYWTVAIGTSTVITGSVPSTTKFTHLAVVGNGGSSGSRTIKLYVDGVLAGTYTTDYNFTSTRVRIGTYWGSSGDYFQGYIDEVRLSIGVQRWTTNFDPPYTEYN